MEISIYRNSVGDQSNYTWYVAVPHPEQFALDEESGEFELLRASDPEDMFHGYSRTKIGAKRAAKKACRRYVEDDWLFKRVSRFNYLRGRVINEV